MKVLGKVIDKGSQGRVTLIAEEDEDMWHTYNLIAVGDILTSTTIRKVQTESATGSTSSNKVRTTLTIKVETIDYDTTACALRVKGRNVQENAYVKMGAYHTLDLEKNRKFTIEKEEWDEVSLDRLEMASDPSQSADIAAVIMQEGICYVSLVTACMTVPCGKIDVHIPRKRQGFQSQHAKGMEKFYEQIAQTMIRRLRFDVLKCVILASPGFVKDQFYAYIMTKSTKDDAYKVFSDNKSKFILAKSTSGFKHALKEILEDSSLQQSLANTKAAKDVKALNDFYQMLNVSQHRAFYGIDFVELASKESAIDVLLVCDSLFRSPNITERKRYIKLVDDVKSNGGTVHIFSSLHISGERLNQITGVAAILRFPMAELDKSSSEDEADEVPNGKLKNNDENPDL